MFSELVVAYLFLGGAGAGACAVLAILGLLADGDDVRRCATLRFRDGRGRFYGGFFGGTLVGAAAVLGLGAWQPMWGAPIDCWFLRRLR